MGGLEENVKKATIDLREAVLADLAKNITYDQKTFQEVSNSLDEGVAKGYIPDNPLKQAVITQSVTTKTTVTQTVTTMVVATVTRNETSPSAQVTQQTTAMTETKKELRRFVFTGTDTCQKEGSAVFCDNDENSTRAFTIETQKFKVTWNTSRLTDPTEWWCTIHVTGTYCYGISCYYYNWQNVGSIRVDITPRSNGETIIDRSSWNQNIREGRIDLDLWVRAIGAGEWFITIEEIEE